MKYLATALLAATFGLQAAEQPKNIIMVVGDGMGPAVTTGYRYFADNPDTPEIEDTVFDRHLVGMASTYPAHVSGLVTDSAAGATALSAGVKSYNGAIAVDVDKKPLPTVLQWAKEKGMKTGVAVTSQINHATPASYAVHNDSRKNYDAIADSMFDHKINGQFVLDVMLGGGWDYFIRDDRNIVDEFKQAGYHYISDVNQLSNTPADKPLLGLFADTGMDWALDMPNQPRLKAMTETAVKHLENDKGFFLLVEGSQVDWAEHGNDIASAMAEMHDLALTLEWLEQYVEQHPDTLVVVTADHSTGGLTIGANGKYEWKPAPLKSLKASPINIARLAVKSKTPSSVVAEQTGLRLTSKEKKAINKTEKDEKAMFKAITKLLDKRSNTGWTSSGHTAVDVQVFAMGKWKQQFAGHIDNTDIPKTLFQMLGKPQ
ncbi:alkaline phosphatase [Aestuariibacter sp. AA17]|uniref:Alkaline phosphatase n=1 Tax=Fluctibacter corallii TaxID=2984329 RepID=A0ABT3ACQ7_9ALTE|nr:alkaline phosphatase [Aestuariibacter sp. AA17]MCV2886072.1 alkaline phosphatase [Aestuariibacter sp. AA17]